MTALQRSLYRSVKNMNIQHLKTSVHELLTDKPLIAISKDLEKVVHIYVRCAVRDGFVNVDNAVWINVGDGIWNAIRNADETRP